MDGVCLVMALLQTTMHPHQVYWDKTSSQNLEYLNWAIFPVRSQKHTVPLNIYLSHPASNLAHKFAAHGVKWKFGQTSFFGKRIIPGELPVVHYKCLDERCRRSASLLRSCHKSKSLYDCNVSKPHRSFPIIMMHRPPKTVAPKHLWPTLREKRDTYMPSWWRIMANSSTLLRPRCA